MPTYSVKISKGLDNFKKIRDSSVRIATGYELERCGSIPGSGNIFLISTMSRPALGPTLPPIQWVAGALSPKIKRLGREADYSPSSSAEVKNGGAIPPLPYVFMSWCLIN
jgi:hypothetical protein